PATLALSREHPAMWQLPTHYLWWILALLLIAGELLLPGYFLLWIGVAAALMGVLLWVVPTLSLLTQAILFGLLAFAACFAYARWLRPKLERRAPGSARLNRRAEQMIGQRSGSAAGQHGGSGCRRWHHAEGARGRMSEAMSPPFATAALTTRIAFLLELARRLHQYGTAAPRLEVAVHRAARRLGVQADVWSSPTAIIISFA